MTMRNYWAKIIPVLWCSALAAQAPPRPDLALGIAAYEQKDFANAVAHLKKVQMPEIADYTGYFLAAARVGAAGVTGPASGAGTATAPVQLPAGDRESIVADAAAVAGLAR